MKAAQIFIFLAFICLFKSQGSESNLDIVVWDTPIKENEISKVFFPANTPLSVILKSKTKEVIPIGVRSKNFPHLNQKRNISGHQTDILLLRYSKCNEPDELSIIQEIGHEKNEKVLAKVTLYPVTVSLQCSESDLYDSSFVELDEGFSADYAFKVTPWHDELKNRLRLAILPPILGTPKMALKEPVLKKESGKDSTEILPECGPGVTAIVSLLARQSDKDLWDECGNRLKLVVQSDKKKIAGRESPVDKELENYLDRIWPDVSKDRDVETRKKGFERLKQLLRDYPDIPYLRETFSDWLIRGREMYLWTLASQKELTYHDIMSLAQLAIERVPLPVSMLSTKGETIAPVEK